MPLTLNALELRNPTLSMNALGLLLGRRYGQQVVAQLYKVCLNPAPVFFLGHGSAHTWDAR